MKKIKLLEEQLQELRIERETVDKRLENIELEKKVLINKEEEIQDEISKIKEDGVNQFLGKFAIINDKWGSKNHYMYITSVATNFTGSLASFNGPNFVIDDRSYFERTQVCCIHRSAQDTHISIEDPKEVTIITKEEFLEAFDEFQKTVKERMVAAVNAVPKRTTKLEYKYKDEFCVGDVI